MISRTELYKTPEFWLEKIQNEIFRQVYSFMEKEGMNQTQLAERFGVSKGYITQILNGDFNFSLKKLIDLSLKIGVVPDLHFKTIEIFTLEEELRLHQIFGDHNKLEDGFVFDTSLSKIQGTNSIAFQDKDPASYG